jgi:polyphosphate kinase 2 (PPK2 family)
MFAKTHTDAAPWIVIPSVDKYHARVAVLEHVVNALENHLK